MRDETDGGATIDMEPSRSSLQNNSRRQKLGDILNSSNLHDFSNGENLDESGNNDRLNWRNDSQMSTNSVDPTIGFGSPYGNSPYSQLASPCSKSPWITLPDPYNNNRDDDCFAPRDGLIGSIIREEGHVYSLAASGDLLYTGSDSKNIRVWKNLKEHSGFKSRSGLVKSIVISGDKIFTGHQDGKIRVWKLSGRKSNHHKRIGSLPTFKHFVKSSVNPKNYVEVRRHRNVVRIRHYDAVSSLSLNEELGLLYSGSWDKTLKIWRLSDSKCLESIAAHDDAINAVVSGFDGLAFTGSADGTVKAWRREIHKKGSSTNHVLAQVLLKQESAVTALTISRSSSVLYCGSSDGLVNFWQRDQNHQLIHGGILRGHKKAVLCLASGGNLVFSGSADKNICVWRREEEPSAGKSGVHTCLSVLTGHTGPVKCLSVEEDEQNTGKNGRDKRWIVYSGSFDKSVKVWRVSPYAPSLKDVEDYYLRMSDHNVAGRLYS